MGSKPTWFAGICLESQVPGSVLPVSLKSDYVKAGRNELGVIYNLVSLPIDSGIGHAYN